MNSPFSVMLSLFTFWSGCLLFAEEPNICYLQENFKNDSERAVFNRPDKQITLGIDATDARRSLLSANTKEDGILFPFFLPQKGLPNLLKEYDLSFDFRFQGKDGSFTLLLKGDKNSAAEKLVFTTKHVISDDISKPFPYEIEPNQWQKAVLQGNQRRTFLYVTHDGQYMKIAELKPIPIQEGINILTEAGKPFSISNLNLCSPQPLPNVSVFRHFANPKSLKSPDGFQSAKECPLITVNANDEYGITLRAGEVPNSVVAKVNWSNGHVTEFRFRTEGIEHTLPVSFGDKKPGDKLFLSDAVIQIRAPSGTSIHTIYVRPMLRRFHSDTTAVPAYYDLLREWDQLPKAGEHPLDFEFRTMENGKTAMYVDGSYLRPIKQPEAGTTVKNIVFEVRNDASTRNAFSRKTDEYKGYHLIDLSKNPRARAFFDAKLDGLEPGLKLFDGVPVIVADPKNSADVGICHQGMGAWDHTDEYLVRTTVDGFPSAIHYRVPSASYKAAWVLFALDSNPKKESILTTRIGTYLQNGSGVDKISDHTLVFSSDGKSTTDAKIVGSILKQNGEKTPLYLIRIPINMGKILDLTSPETPLDFEFFGKPNTNPGHVDSVCKPDPDSLSSFQIFGVSLEKAPVSAIKAPSSEK